jgi:hypothetical protein
VRWPWTAAMLILAALASAQADDAQQHGAVFIISQDGLNNAPQLYKQFIAEAIQDGNAKMKKPRYFCDTLDGVEGCSVASCSCFVREKPAFVRMFPDRLTGTVGPNRDIFKLAGGASAIRLELLPAGDGYLGAVKFTVSDCSPCSRAVSQLRQGI